MVTGETVKNAKILSDDETRRLFKSALRARPEGVSEDDLKEIYNWAVGVRIDSAALNLVLEGRINISLKNGEPCFSPCERNGAAND
jgi:hypothetical protein